jgi:hypothetical protein
MNWSHGTVRRPLAATAAAALTLLAAACGTAASSSSSPAAPAASATTSAPAAPTTPATSTTPTAAATSPAATAAASTAPASSPSTTSGSADGTPPCTTSALSARLGASQGAAGSSYIELDFTNISGAACTLYGYPGVSFTAAGTGAAAQIGAAATRDPSSAAKLVTLAPKAVAGAVLRVAVAANYPAAACHPVTARYLRVYPPGERTPLYVAFTSPACSSASSPVLQIAVVQPGAGDAS